MNGIPSKKSRTAQVSRRGFLANVSTASLVLMGRISAGQDAGLTDPNRTDVDSFAPDFFVSIAPNGIVTCLAHRSEMGTGIRTGLPRVIAEELEADWNRVTIQQAIGDKRLGDQNTDGSNSIRFFFDRMRIAGATARTMLEQAAAKKWAVAESECRARNHEVEHVTSGRKLGFGELVSIARTLDIPEESSLKLKPRKDWRYIGKDAPIADMEDILTGKAVYGIDARMENQLFALIAQPPVVGAKHIAVDDTETRAVKGVVDVVPLPTFQGAPNFQPLGGVAVLATSTWAASQGRDALQVEWDLGSNADYDTEAFTKELVETARRPGKVLRRAGNASAALSDANRIVTADYTVPHLARAPMETPAAVADVECDADGKVIRCEILAATQNPQAVQQAVGPALGLPAEDVLVNVTLLGAGFGRKSKPDYCVEAALLSKHAKRPVHVTWMREDDIQHDYYHAISAVHCEAALDVEGKPTAWVQRAVYPTIGSTFSPAAKSPATWEAEMGNTDLPFDVPNLSLEVGEAKAHVRIGWLRSVCHIQQNFAVGSFADELAQAAGVDPLEYWMSILGNDRTLDTAAAGLSNRGASVQDYPYDIGRLKNVLRRSANMADWPRRKQLPSGKGLGIACARSFLGYTGHVVEVEVSRDGELKIPNVWVSLDAGTIVSPDRVRSQVEGAAIMAATQALYGKISFRNGVADQNNFDGYPVAKMFDAPQHIAVDIVDSDAAPAGVGETGVPSFAPALCNAIFQACGKRVRNLPIDEHDLSWA